MSLTKIAYVLLFIGGILLLSITSENFISTIIEAIEAKFGITSNTIALYFLILLIGIAFAGLILCIIAIVKNDTNAVIPLICFILLLVFFICRYFTFHMFVAGMSSQGGQVVQTGQGGGRMGRYKIGDTGPGGGIVFAVEGNTGMEVSRLLGTFNWNDAVNTAKNYNCNGMNDWHLPSRDELNLIYENLQKAGVINLGTGVYWSFSQSNTYYAWYQYFSDGRQYISMNKHDTYSVRAIRAF